MDENGKKMHYRQKDKMSDPCILPATPHREPREAAESWSLSQPSPPLRWSGDLLPRQTPTLGWGQKYLHCSLKAVLPTSHFLSIPRFRRYKTRSTSWAESSGKKAGAKRNLPLPQALSHLSTRGTPVQGPGHSAQELPPFR